MANDELSPIHPGEILREEFLSPNSTSTAQLAEKMAVPVSDVNLLVQGRRNVTADVAAGLSKALGTSVEFWLNLQRAYDVEVDSRHRRTGNT